MWMAHNSWTGWVMIENAVIVGAVLLADAFAVVFL